VSGNREMNALPPTRGPAGAITAKGPGQHHPCCKAPGAKTLSGPGSRERRPFPCWRRVRKAQPPALNPLQHVGAPAEEVSTRPPPAQTPIPVARPDRPKQMKPRSFSGRGTSRGDQRGHPGTPNRNVDHPSPQPQPRAASPFASSQGHQDTQAGKKTCRGFRRSGHPHRWSQQAPPISEGRPQPRTRPQPPADQWGPCPQK